ncbi:MAG: restriction endonuclease subunit S [Nitrospirota bacterium]
MSTIWPQIKLSEVLRHISRLEKVNPMKEYRLLGIRLDGGGPFLREIKTGAKIAANNLLRVHTGDFIYSRLFAWRGAFGVITADLNGCFVSGEFPTFIPVKDKINAEFLRLWFRLPTTISVVEADCSGSTPLTRNRFKEQFFLNMKIPLPSLSEQQRIVAKIEKLAVKIEEAQDQRRQAIEEAESLFASASEAAFEKKPSWTESRVSDLCEQPQYGYTASAVMEPVGPKLLRITDIQNGRVVWDTVPFCHCSKPSQYLLQDGDILFARTGATTGKSFLIRNCPETVFASYLIRLRVKQSVTAEYLYKYFQTPSYWLQIIAQKKGTGQPNVNGKKLANIVVPIAPLEEQNRIVAHLDNLQSRINKLKRLQTETQKELDALMPSILDKALKGEL